MGILGGLFGKGERSGEEKKQIPWIALSSVNQLAQIEAKSKERTQLIFKHSTTCGISRMVLNLFTSNYRPEIDVDYNFLDLHAYREVSNEAGIHFQVLHQSPQLLIIKNGQTVFHTSHGSISETDLEAFV